MANFPEALIDTFVGYAEDDSPDHIGFILSRTLTKTTNGDAEEAGTVDQSLRDKTGCHLTKQPNAPYEAADECVLPSSQIVSSLPLL